VTAASSPAASLQPVELRPHRWRKAFAFVVLWAAFTAIGVLALASGDWFVGVLTVGFFGVGGLIAMPQAFRRRSIYLDAHGIEIRQPVATIKLPWSEVEEVGLVDLQPWRLWSPKMVGLRVRDPDAVTQQISRGRGPGPAVRNRSALRALQRGSRGLSGYDVGLSWIDRDRSPEKLVELIERYRAAAS